MPDNRPTPFPNKKYNHTKTFKNMATSQCPELKHYIAGTQCQENFAGMGAVVYAFDRSKLAADDLTVSGNTYTFKTGTTVKLYKYECKEEKQNLKGSSQGRRQGFVITGAFVLEAVDKLTSEMARAFNNLDLGWIFPESDGTAQILYDPVRKVHIDADGLSTDTGTAPGDERITSVEMKLGPVKYPNLYVDVPDGGWDSMLATS